MDRNEAAHARVRGGAAHAGSTRALAASLACALLMVPSLSAQRVRSGATPPARPRFEGGVSRTELGCGRLVARLPRIAGVHYCRGRLPSMALGIDRIVFFFARNLDDEREISLELTEEALWAGTRRARASAWPGWTGDVAAANSRVKIRRAADAALRRELEVRIDDGSVFHLAVYHDGEPRSPRIAQLAARDIEQLVTQLSSTLEPGPTGPMVPSTVRVPMRGGAVTLTVPEGVFLLPAHVLVEADCLAGFALDERADGDRRSGLRGTAFDRCRDGRVVHGGGRVPPNIAAALASIGAVARSP